jgi:hypothetical protein
MKAINETEILEKALFEAYRLLKAGFSGWRVPIFYNIVENKLAMGTAMSSGTWQPGKNNSGKIIDEEVFSISVSDMDIECDEKCESFEEYLAYAIPEMVFDYLNNLREGVNDYIERKEN